MNTRSKKVVFELLSKYLRLVEIDLTIKVFGKVLLRYHFPPKVKDGDVSDSGLCV